MTRFNAIESLLSGVNAKTQIDQAQQNRKLSRLQSALAGQIAEGSFDLNSNLDFAQIAALDPERAGRMALVFNNLSEGRKKGYFEDLQTILNSLEAGDTQRALNITDKRLSDINKLNGDPSGTLMIKQRIMNGDIPSTIANLKKVEAVGIDRGYLADPLDRQIKQAQITKAGKTSPEIGKYLPRDYTIDSWTKFSKSKNPADLVRFGGAEREKDLEIKIAKLQLQTEKAELERQKAKQKNLAREIEAAQKKQDAERAKFLQDQEANNSIQNIDALLDSDLDIIYGGFEWVVPDKLRAQKGKNMLSRRDNVISTMSLMAAGKLKGQGTITDPEREMLAKAATLLQNEDISSKMAQAELTRIRPIFEFFLTGERPINSTGYVVTDPGGEIMTDAQGNRARVFPDGRVEEL